MTRKEALAELIAKVGSGEFDAPPSSARAPFFNAFMNIAEIALPQNVTGCSALAWRAYNIASLDAALALHQAVLPSARVHDLSQFERGWACVLNGDIPPHFFYGDADTPARAWMLAILKALHEMEENK